MVVLVVPTSIYFGSCCICRILLYNGAYCWIMPYLPYPAVSCRILPHPAISCRILPYPAVSCRILPYPAVSCCRLLYPAVSCRTLNTCIGETILSSLVQTLGHPCSAALPNQSVLSCSIMAYTVRPCRICRIPRYPAVSCCILLFLPYPPTSCRILQYPAVSCRILLYAAVSCRIQPYRIRVLGKPYCPPWSRAWGSFAALHCQISQGEGCSTRGHQVPCERHRPIGHADPQRWLLGALLTRSSPPEAGCPARLVPRTRLRRRECPQPVQLVRLLKEQGAPA